jgi:hypothetical protein
MKALELKSKAVNAAQVKGGCWGCIAVDMVAQAIKDLIHQ